MTSSPHSAPAALSRRAVIAAGGALAATATFAGTATAAAPGGTSSGAARKPRRKRLTNLAHLDFLTDRVAVESTAAHSSYRLDSDPRIGVIWVYADAVDGGGFRRVGGGAYDAATDTWGQGAYDSDDMTRAAVCYLREWQATGSRHAREQAYQQLRGVAYFQTLTGASAGNGILWMQPDGSFNAAPTPPDDPNPADSATSYWTARTLWAYGEGYAAFRRNDARFAKFLSDRVALTLTALERDVLVRYGKYQVIHGVTVPDWLIVDGADATSEAMLGLAAYVRAGGPHARRAAAALEKFARGVAEMADGTSTRWPFRAVLPWALSRSDWHAWGSQMSSALAAASSALKDKALLPAAVGDTAGFTAHLLTSTGPVNGLLPTPGDKVIIAYGVDARLQACVGVGEATRRPAISALGGLAAAWYFGANAAGTPVYDPWTGWTADGVAPDGTVNRNGGAESTIHGVLSMQVLDAHPELAVLARAAAGQSRTDGLQVLEAESAMLAGAARVFTPESAWTGESLWSGSAVELGTGGTITFALPASDQDRLVQPVIARTAGSDGRARASAGSRSLGTVEFGTGAQGAAPSPDELLPVELLGAVGGGDRSVVFTGARGTGRVDALQVMPELATLTATGEGRQVWLISSKAKHARSRELTLDRSGRAWVCDRDGRTVRELRLRAGRQRLTVPAGGFLLVVS